MNKHAILIGVNEVPHLDYLSTPSSYAIAMNDWAISQGFKTFLFVDEPDDRIVAGNCSRTDILRSIRGIIEETDQLLIYFAGHGVESTATNDIWLLPGYKDDPSDCISISLNKALAYSSGVPHVIFISDACRSPSNTDYLRAATGSAILPKLERLNPTTEVDVLFSTWPGKISVDVRDEKGIYRSTYSDCLLECLHGQIKEVILEVRKVKPGFPAVMTDELNSYLKKTVPLEMEKKVELHSFRWEK
ncbi:caspase family protein [Chryseobacterium joostei]|uniref:Caspase domain-containing protein n=1 Tax=Chryseobacterium joostei TaxID=112234 RepID=A0A1N7KNZ0_9FLAO|nr:caspase family protein [Chryseobacterium joostei]AZB01817.1 caspase family protein [Chryseobacterium joostei]SIS63264.1 Caspase domain-containing protein [Chryseobacterium joostei]